MHPEWKSILKYFTTPTWSICTSVERYPHNQSCIIIECLKNVFCYESYLDCINNDKRRKTLTRFRLSSHSLSIGTGRYNGITRNERKCVLCTQNVRESEYHFLLCCPLYKELRNKYNITSSWPNWNVFTKTMSDYSTPSINNVAKFLHEAFILREV